MAAETAENDSSQEPPPFAAAAAAAGGPNPCCAKLWKKYQQIEKGRTVLREAVKLLNSEIDKVRNENSSLSEVCKEERLRADSAEAARETESDARDTLEKEVIELKAENSSLHQKQNFSKTNDDLLRISELEEENRRLKQAIGEEKLKRDSEKKKVEEAKSKALEAQKLLKSETHKSEEYKRLADTERKIANDLKASCEKLRIEVNEARAQLSAQIQKTEDAHKKADAEKQKAAREKKCADSEKLLAEKNKKLIEVERKKAMEEKSRSNKLVAQLEEQKKLNGSLQVSIEAQRKNAMSEKNRADHLLQKLEEERKRSECLQSKSGNFSATRDMVSLGKHGIQQIDVATESANIRLLKEKLKRKKDQINHMKKESKLEKALIRREIELLKQDWMQPLNRFNMLDDYLAGGVEVPAMKKLKRQPEVHDMDRTLRPHNPVTAPYFGLQAGIVPFTSTPREYTSYQLPRESCTRPISGTSSELEPPIGSALRTESKNHHRSSCPTSDKKFMGSQGKESLFVSSTGIRKNQNSTGSELPPKDCSTRKQDRALLEISGHSSQQKALKSSLPGGTEVADQMPNGRRKRKRTKHSVKSLSHDVTTNDYLAFSDDRSCQQQRNIVIPSITEEGLQKHSRKCHVAFDKSLSDCAKVLSPGAGKACAGSEFASLLTFEKLIEGDCLKLLNLDNDADEEKYRKAMERPLSPDVPIVLPTITRRPMSTHLVDGNNGEYDKDCPASRSVGSLSEVQKLSEKAKFQSPCSRTEHDGTGKELCANNKSNAAYDDPYNTKSVDASVTARLVNVSRENMASNTVVSVAVNSTNTIGPRFSGSSCRGHTSASLHLAPNKSRLSQMFDASSDPELQSNNVGTSKTQIAEPVNLISNSTIARCHGAENNTVDFVGVSSLKRSSLIKILRYWDALTSEASKLSQDIYVDGPLLERVSTEPLLLPEERVPLIFSLFLWDVRKLTSEPVVGQDFASSAFSMIVKPYMERRLVFLKGNHLDVLISLIEDFLVNKEVMVCDKMGVMNSDASKYCHLDDETDIQVSTKPATINQFISACILLASICVKAERLDVVLEVSYRVLQMGKLNLSWTMLALHVFGSVCCDKLRLLESCNLLMTTIRLVVLLLESTYASSCLVSSYIQSNRSTAFQSCTHCVFDVDTVSIDVFISSLLDELHLCALSWNNHTNSNEAITRQISHLGSSGLEISCGETCNISKQAKLTEGTNYPAGRDLCYFSEIISLLELFGSYMSCQWTYKNVVVRLLKILESCTCEEYSAALLVLVSHLGRFFIDDVGYETEPVVELRNKLAVLIGTSFTISRSIPVQFSAIGALLSLFPLTFDKIIASQTGPLSGLCVVQASQISEWFAQLSKENQSFACSFFS